MIAPEDVRHLRLAFYTDTKASWLLCRHFAGITAENYAAYIAERQEFLRPLPAYYGIELIAYHPLRSIYRPKLFPEKFDDSCCMDFECAARLIEAIADFSESAVISLSLYGEPLLHPQFVTIVGQILNHRHLSVLIETSGIVEKTAAYLEDFDRLVQICRDIPPRSNGRLPIYWIVDIDAAGAVSHTFYLLTPRHDVRIVRGKMAEIMSDGFDPLSHEDYICVELSDTDAVLAAHEKLRRVYPNLFLITRPNIHVGHSSNEVRNYERGKSDLHLFADFYAEMTTEKMTQEETEELTHIIDALEREERMQ